MPWTTTFELDADAALAAARADVAAEPSRFGQESLALGSEREGPAGALAFAFGRDTLAPGETTRAFLVFAKGGLE